MKVRTRFAPSPTGYLHIGSARTALYNWLFARKHQGVFILRIEDTDLERSTPESVQAILDAMTWLGLDYQEGPFYQTNRFDRYRQALDFLLEQNKAYRCYCTKERLETLREQQLAHKEKPRYDGHCRYNALTPQGTQPYVIRFKNPIAGEVVFDDQVFGQLSFQNSELDDLILARTDGTPTYNFTVVVDDWDMDITHVIRGDDHINNTPRQINILQALDAKIPVYAHVPMILGTDGKRLSKRHGALSVMQYRDEGYLPDALLNYLVRLGWSQGDREIFSREEMTQSFSLRNINRSPAAMNPDKLLWLNQHYLKTDKISTLLPLFKHSLMKLMQESTERPLTHDSMDANFCPSLEDVILAQRDRCKTITEMAEKSLFFYVMPAYHLEAANKNLNRDTLNVLKELQNNLTLLKEWHKESIHEVIQISASKLNFGLGKVAQPLRVAVTGNTISPSIDLTLFLLGKTETLKRLTKAIEYILALPQNTHLTSK